MMYKTLHIKLKIEQQEPHVPLYIDDVPSLMNSLVILSIAYVPRRLKHHRYRYACYTSKLTVRADKERFQFSHCELSIYMYQHSSCTFIWSICLSVDPYSRACDFYHDFLGRGMLLIRKLLNQGFLIVKLKSIRKLYGGHHDLANYYESVLQMTTDTTVCRNHNMVFS